MNGNVKNILFLILGLFIPSISLYLILAITTGWDQWGYSMAIFLLSIILGIVLACIKKTRYLGFGLIIWFLCMIILEITGILII